MEGKVQIAIVGSGPAGLSAAARAHKRGVSYVLLEKTSELSNTIRQYQKHKKVMAAPAELPLRKEIEISFQECTRKTRSIPGNGRPTS